MPISPNVLTPRQAEAGKVKIGRRSERQHTAKGSGRAYSPPQKLETKDGPYFLITKTIRDQTGPENFIVDTTLMATLAEFSDKDKHLRRIPIMLDSDDIEEVFPSALTDYRGSKLWCIGSGAGKDAATRYDREHPRKVDCPCDLLSSGECKPGGTLWFTILAGHDTIVGMRHAFRTHSWNSLRALQGGLLAVQRIVGTVCGVKLWLNVKHHLTKRRDGTWTKVPLVSVMIHADDIPNAQRNVIATRQRRLAVLQVPSEPVVLGLPGPGEGETERQQEEVAAEWFHTATGASSSAEGQSEPEEDGEAEEIDYDPVTGVVRDSNEPQSRRATDPALGLGDVVSDTPAIYKRDQWGRVDATWSKDHPGRLRLGQVLRRLAFLRGLDIGEGPAGQRALKDVIAEVTERFFGKPILFGNLTPKQAGDLDAYAITEIQQREAEIREDDDGDDGDDGGSAEDDDEIPG